MPKTTLVQQFIFCTTTENRKKSVAILHALLRNANGIICVINAIIVSKGSFY